MLSLLVGSTAIAAAPEGAERARVPNASVADTVEKLQKQVKKLRKKVKGLSKQQGPVGPQGEQGEQGPQGPQGPATGPAGGDLTGNYPDPTIGPDAVGSTEVTDGSLRGTDIGDDSLTGDDVTNGSLTDGDVADGSLTGADISSDSLGGGDIQEGTLGQVPSALLGGFGRTGGEAFCDPTSQAFLHCASTGFMTVPPGARALVLARVRAFDNTGGDGVGDCRLASSSLGFIPNSTVRFAVETFEYATLIGATPPLPAGATDFGIECNQVDSIFYDDVSATAVLISGS